MVWRPIMSRPEFHVQARFQFYKDEETMIKNWKKMAKNNANQNTFLEGMLLKSLVEECPEFVDYSVFYGGMKADESRYCGFDNVLKVRNHTYSTEIRAKKVKEKGYYDELECVVRNGLGQLPRTPVSKDSVYLLSAFKAAEHTERLEQIWTTWTGARYILWTCPKVLSLRRVTFLRTTTRLDDFSYLVLCECEEGLNWINQAKTFMDKLRERRCGLVGLYKVERYYIPPRERRSI